MAHPHSPTPLSSSSGLLIVGTDTGVGKTLITGLLVRGLQQRGLRPGVMKPIETGVREGPERSSDADRLLALLPHHESRSLISPYRFFQALGPLAAARLAGQTIELPTILSAYQSLASRHDYMLIEGIGGVMVPLSPNQDFRDLMTALALPCLLVSRAALGAVNHTLLTIRALEERRIPMAGIVFNTLSEPGQQPGDILAIPSTIEQVRERTGIPIFGPLRFRRNVSEQWETGVEECLADQAVADLIQHVAGHIASNP